MYPQPDYTLLGFAALLSVLSDSGYRPMYLQSDYTLVPFVRTHIEARLQTRVRERSFLGAWDLFTDFTNTKSAQSRRSTHNDVGTSPTGKRRRVCQGTSSSVSAAAGEHDEETHT